MMKKIDKLEDLDTVEFVDDKTNKSIEYCLNSKYQDETQYLTRMPINKKRLEEAIEQIESGAYIVKDIDNVTKE